MADKRWVGTTGDVNTAGNYSASGVPGAADNLQVPAGSGAISASLSTLAAVSLGTVKVERGYTGAIGTNTSGVITYFQFLSSRFEFAGGGTSYIDIGSSAISPIVRETARPSTGYQGLYLKGSAISTLNVEKGYVGVAAWIGETATIATLRLNTRDANAFIGSGTTLTTAYMVDGNLILDCALVTLTIESGACRTTGTGTITTVNVNGGTFLPHSTGTITTLNQTGGTVDFTGHNIARTVTTYNANGGVLIADESIVTFTNKPTSTGVFSRTFVRV